MTPHFRSKFIVISSSIIAKLTIPSQCQSHIEKQRTYEFHLLKNFGYTWAVCAYLALPAHYLKITPAIEEMRLNAVIDGHLRYIKRLIGFEQVMLHTRFQILRSLQSKQKQQAYIDQLRQDNPDWGNVQEEITPI